MPKMKLSRLDLVWISGTIALIVISVGIIVLTTVITMPVIYVFAANNGWSLAGAQGYVLCMIAFEAVYLCWLFLNWWYRKLPSGG